jgi:hypothetical protein
MMCWYLRRDDIRSGQLQPVVRECDLPVAIFADSRNRIDFISQVTKSKIGF